MNKSFVAQTFSSEREMHKWLENPSNLEKLKKKYPPAKFSGRMELVDKQIVITKKK